MKIPGPRPSQLGVGALVVAALAVGQLLNDHLPGEEVTARPFLVATSLGDEASLRAGDLTVTSIDGGPSYVDGSGGYVSPGLFVVVSFVWTARSEPSSIAYGELRTRAGGLTMLNSFGDRTRIECPRTTVGLPSRCFAAVEASPDELVGARLRLGIDPLDERYDAMADVDLGIDAAVVSSWTSAEDPVSAPAVGDVGAVRTP